MTGVAMESSWRGAFSPVALTGVLKRVADEARSGELQIVSGNWIKTIRVDEGAVRFAKSNMRQDRLGESMLAHEFISEQDYRLASQKMEHDGCRFGEALLKMGRLDRQQLHRELGVQVQRIVLSLFRISEGLYSFEESETHDAPLPFSLSVPPLLLKGLRRVEDGRMILSALPPAETHVRIALHPPDKIDQSRLATVERAVLEKAGDGLSIGEIVRDSKVRDSKIERSVALRSCFSLLTVGLLEVVPEAPPEAVESTPEEQQARELITAQFERLDHAAEEDLLGVRRDAPEEELRDAYEGLCNEWAEVRAQTKDPELIEKLESIEFRLAAAYHQLLVERDRESVPDGGGTPEDADGVARRARIEQLDRDAKLHLQVKDWNGAVSLLHELVALAPSNASYQMMLGQAMQFHPTLKKTAEEHFVQAIELAPNDAKMHVALGRYYQRLKKHARAITSLERAIELEPGNDDARRYLEAGQQPKGMSGLLKKIFQ